MNILRVGDKLEVAVDFPNFTQEVMGAILTVINPDGHDPSHPDRFNTDSTTARKGIWQFDLNDLASGVLKFHSIANVTIVPVTIRIPLCSPLDYAYEIHGRSVGAIKTIKCECGAHVVKDHMHSSWCPSFSPTWRNL